jgi:hypothetical protein
MQGIRSLSAGFRKGKNLSHCQEAYLSFYIQEMNDIGFPIFSEAVNANANAFQALSHKDSNSELRVKGKRWARCFLSHFNKKDFNTHVQETLEIGHFVAQQPKIIPILVKNLDVAW